MSRQSSVVSRQLSVVSCQLSVISHQSSVVSRQLFKYRWQAPKKFHVDLSLISFTEINKSQIPNPKS